MAEATRQTVRRWVMTGAVSAVVIAGTVAGARLKDEQDVKKEYKRLQDATPEDRIAQLEAARVPLLARKMDIERKIENFHERLKAQEEKVRMGPQTKVDRKIAELRAQMKQSQLEKEEKARQLAERRAQAKAQAELQER